LINLELVINYFVLSLRILGQKFAMLELKTTLSMLLRSYRFLPDEDHKPKPLAELVTKSGNGIRLRILSRDQNGTSAQ